MDPNETELIAVGIDCECLAGQRGQAPDVIGPHHLSNCSMHDGSVATFRKSKRAQTNEDYETWVEESTTNTLNCFDVGDTRAVDLIVEPQVAVRRLTPLECERLQGLPDDWTRYRVDAKTGKVVEQSDSARYKQVGNGGAVPCVRWIGDRVIRKDELLSLMFVGACEECGNDDPTEGMRVCLDCAEALAVIESA